MKTWKEAYDPGPRRRDLIWACGRELSQVSEWAVEIVLIEFFAKVELAETEFNDRYPRNGDPIRIETLAKQALCKVQQGMDQYSKYARFRCSSGWNTFNQHSARDIYEWLIGRMIGNKVRL
jgi:hypothetical protein